MANYILHTTLCWIFFYALYAGLLSRATFFGHNRAYLLGSLLVGLLLPMVNWAALLPAEQPELLVFTLQPIIIGMAGLEVSVTAAEPGLGWREALLSLYWLGVGIGGLRFAYGLRKLWKLYCRSHRHRRDGYTLVLTEERHAPFSFFRCLFWSRRTPYLPEDEKKILHHEMAHIRGLHSFDILLVELLGILFWPSPPVYLYSRSLRVVHEYLADEAVLQMTRKKKQYGRLLLSQSQSGQPIALANHFINSQLKKRIVMMTKTKSKRLLLTRYLLALPLVFALAIVFARPALEEEASSVSAEAAAQITNGDVGRMPIFAGCEGEATEKEQASCSKQKLVEFMASKLKYPEEAQRAKVEGKVIVRFTIAKDGEVREAEVLEGIGHGCDEAALAVVMAMPRWTPAMKEGKAVDMKMTLPFTFSLPKGNAQIGEGEEEVFKVVEEMPRFPGCEEEGAAMADLAQCSNMKLIEFIIKNAKYPKEAWDAGMEGTTVASFVVNKEGRVEDIKIVRSVHESLDAEVLRIIRLMNEMEQPWIPGRQKGRLVNVQFNLPVQFRLETERKQLQLPEGAQRLEVRNFLAAPNPTSGQLQLQFEAEARPTVIRLLDSSGREMLREALNRFEGAYSRTLGLDKLPRGVYILHISQGEKIFADRVVLQ